jgi:hypothetical protein
MDGRAMTRLRAALTVAFCLLASGCFKPGPPANPLGAIDVGLRVRDLVERELMLIDERLQMQALDGTLAGSDAAAQLKSSAQQLLGEPIKRETLDGIVKDQQAAAQTFFGSVDAAIAKSSDAHWSSFAAGRMREIRTDYANDMVQGLDPAPDLSSAYEMLARARGVQGSPIVSPFDNAQSDADQVLPTSANLPGPPAAQTVTLIPAG